MIDLKLDLEDLKRVKNKKSEMCDRLRQLDFDQSGLISMESFLAIASKYGIKLNGKDVSYIKETFRKNQSSQKIDYIQTLNDVKMKMNSEGKLEWVVGSKQADYASTPMRVKIIGLKNSDRSYKLPHLNQSMSLNKQKHNFLNDPTPFN